MALGEPSAMANLVVLGDQDGVSRSITDAPPTHYTVKIQSFSLLAKNSVDRYESNHFEAGGYTWKLVIHPNGDKNKNVRQHVSIYLALAEVSSVRHGWEVYAVFRLFLLDQNRDTYLTLEDTAGKDGRRFHRMKLEWGFSEFIPLKAFNDARNGYLVNDMCVFGAEVFVCKERSRGHVEYLSMTKEAITFKHTWEIENFSESDEEYDDSKIENFSELDEEYHDSKAFVAGNYKWKIRLYPIGKGNGLNSHLSLYVVLADTTSLPSGTRIFAEFTLRILDQMYAQHLSGKAKFWFSASNQESGWSRYITHGNFYQTQGGYLMKSTCCVEAEVTILGVVTMG